MDNQQDYLKSGRTALGVSAIAALLAPVCCLGPFLLITLGLSSAWILYLMSLAECSRPFLIIIALLTLILSFQRIWHPISPALMGQTCSIQQDIVTYKGFFIFVVTLVIIILMLPYVAPNIDKL